MVQGQDFMVDVAKHPNQAPIIFAEWPKMCVALHCHNGIQHLFDLSIRAAFLQLHYLISLVVQCRQQNWSFGWVVRVQNRQFLYNPTKLITKPSFDEYQLLSWFTWPAPRSFPLDIVVNNPFFIASYQSF